MEYRIQPFIEKRSDFLSFMKTRYSLFHLSNLFFRDLHYGVMLYLEMNKLPHAYSKSEELAQRVIAEYEKTGILVPIDPRSWMLNYLPFKKPPVKPAAPPKPAPAVAKAAGDSTRPSSTAAASEKPTAAATTPAVEVKSA